MTEVPDHLLQRSRERRAALGGGSAPPSAPAGGGGGGDAGGSSAPVPAAAAAAPVVAEPAAPPPPPPPYVQAALDRKKVPSWMAGAGVVTLLWAFLYAGVLFAPAEELDPVLAHGQEVYNANCAGCHGGSGGGGTGRPLSGEVLLTFPDRADHIAWVLNGSPAAGTPYGDPNRPGGQHISQDGWGAMPGFEGALSPEDIDAVVRYEREVLDDEEPTGEAATDGSHGAEEGGEGDATEGESGGDDPSNQAETQGGSSDESSSSGEDGGSGSGETQGAEEDSTDLDGASEDGGPEGEGNLDPDASGDE
jgi:mono/diheme cytochrome c family protein